MYSTHGAMKNRMQIENGYALPFDGHGLGIEWDWTAVEQLRKGDKAVVSG